jgi:benzoate 4-monooxygenase
MTPPLRANPDQKEKAGKVQMVTSGSTVYPVRWTTIFHSLLIHISNYHITGVKYLAFDIISDLVFGAPFGMIKAARDVAQVPKDPTSVFEAFGDKSAHVESVEIPAVRNLNGCAAAMGVLPAWWRPFARQFPWYKRGMADMKSLAGIATMAVLKRLNSPPLGRVDLLSKLQASKDENGNPMGREELTTEALTMLIAGSDTTSSSTCAIIYHLAKNPHVQRKLQAYLDEHLGTEDLLVATTSQVRRLPYLDACINETLRIHSTSALGLPRMVPEGGLEIAGRYFPEGAIVSVPSFTIHRDKDVWGEDVEAYRPERWEEGDQSLIYATFNPFSLGPRWAPFLSLPLFYSLTTLRAYRACVGRNLATLELQMIIASLLRRYEFVLQNPNEEVRSPAPFLRYPLSNFHC